MRLQGSTLYTRSNLVLFRGFVWRHYKAHGRHDLPWRKTKDPYKILVSEIMLQQTQVQRVIAKYEEFLKAFPTVRVLAAASLSDVLKVWIGLGYNRRAKFLHDAAKQIVERNSGKFPKTYTELRALPGVGDYTAKAIRVFAFNQPEVLIETNIRGALLHHFFPPSRNVPDAKLIPILEQLLHTISNSREWFNALMDYGSHLKQLYPNPSRRSRHHVKQSKFEGSLRQVRGAILRAHTQGEEVSDLRNRYSNQFILAMQSLKRDGLISKRNGKIVLA